MGCGKTTFGKALSKACGASFADLDDLIEEREGRSIREIFAREGEEGFRRIERYRLEEALKQKADILAAGGGTPCFFDNMELINASAVSVWLDAAPSRLLERLTEERSRRPLLSTLSDAELEEKIKKDLQRRGPFYAKAHIRFDASRLDSVQMIRESVERFIATYPALGFAITNPLQ